MDGNHSVINIYMPLDLEYDSAYEDWCNDCWDIWMPPPKRSSYIVESVQRSLDEILEIEIKIIAENTEVDPLTWIHLYAKKYRDLMNIDSSWTISQIKRRLYFKE